MIWMAEVDVIDVVAALPSEKKYVSSVPHHRPPTTRILISLDDTLLSVARFFPPASPETVPSTNEQ